MKFFPAFLTRSIPVILPSLLFAHSVPGQNGLLSGIGHPLGGLDHLLAMLAVGLWASQSGKKSIWMLSCTFIAVMVLGGILGVSGLPLPGVEAGISASVVIAGLLTAFALRLPAPAGCLIVGAFAICHGHAHGTEMPSDTSAILYAIGFIFSTALLLLNGAVFGSLMQELNHKRMTRLAGALIAVSGVFLIAT